MPEHIDWQLWRLVVSPRFSSSLTEIEERWSLTDVLDAHDVLDFLDDLDAEARKGQ